MTWSRNVDEVADEYLLQFSHDVNILIFLLSTDDASFRGNDVNIDKIKGDVLSKYIICEELGRSVITETSTCMTFQ